MNRSAITALAAIAMIVASTPTQGAEPFRRFSLLGDPLAPESCRLRADSETSSETTSGDTPPGCMLLDVAALADFSHLRPPLTVSLQRTAPDGVSREDDSGSGAYALSSNLSAAVAYHHELLFPTASNEDLRTRRFSLFSSDPNRDVLDLHLSWRVSRLSELSFGYQVQSNRASLAAAAESYSVRRFVSEADLDHAVTIGVTRHFGNSD